MSQYKADFIEVPVVPEQTAPVDPEKRLPDSEIRIELCDESDADKIVRILTSHKQYFF
jgi:hypothetical protein